jgi:dipeptidase E
MSRRLLLVSTSTTHGTGYLDHCADAMQEVLGGSRSVLFVPYARPSGLSHDAYTTKARDRFAAMDVALGGIHEAGDPVAAVRNAEALFIGGGNTFVLLRGLYEAGVIDAIRERVAGGMPYLGTSAGSNVACVTLGTTNDMPVVEPPHFAALGLVPFNINPHYLDPDPDSTHMGETRATRINEFHAFNNQPVIGLREGAMLHVDEDAMTLRGTSGARLFRKGQEPDEFAPGDDMSFLL